MAFAASLASPLTLVELHPTFFRRIIWSYELFILQRKKGDSGTSLSYVKIAVGLRLAGTYTYILLYVSGF